MVIEFKESKQVNPFRQTLHAGQDPDFYTQLRKCTLGGRNLGAKVFVSVFNPKLRSLEKGKSKFSRLVLHAEPFPTYGKIFYNNQCAFVTQSDSGVNTTAREVAQNTIDRLQRQRQTNETREQLAQFKQVKIYEFKDGILHQTPMVIEFKESNNVNTFRDTLDPEQELGYQISAGKDIVTGMKADIKYWVESYTTGSFHRGSTALSRMSSLVYRNYDQAMQKDTGKSMLSTIDGIIAKRKQDLGRSFTIMFDGVNYDYSQEEQHIAQDSLALEIAREIFESTQKLCLEAKELFPEGKLNPIADHIGFLRNGTRVANRCPH